MLIKGFLLSPSFGWVMRDLLLMLSYCDLLLSLHLPFLKESANISVGRLLGGLSGSPVFVVELPTTFVIQGSPRAKLFEVLDYGKKKKEGAKEGLAVRLRSN